MKKPKIKVDKRAILDFFVQHVEKIVLGGVLACFLLIVYSAMARDTAPKTPDQQVATPDKLASLATTAEGSWAGTQFKPELYPIPPYPEIAALIREPLKEKDFLPPTGAIELKPALFPPRRKRAEPPLYSVVKLQGSAACGQVPVVNDYNEIAAQPGVLVLQPAGNAYQGQRWIVLTALVPIDEQMQAYDDTFKSAQLQTDTDEPDYVGYVVQRAVDDGQPIDWSTSEVFYSGVARDQVNTNWPTGSTAQEVVESEYLDEALGFPLLPVIDPDWDETVAHLPEIPLISDAVDGNTGTTDPGTDPLDPFGAAAAPAAGAGGHQPSYLAANDEPVLEYMLFRFFDINVEPGTRYRYRVSLVLRNPNETVADSFLSTELLERKREIDQQAAEQTALGNAAQAAAIQREWTYLQSDWSDPSPPILVPRDSRLLAMDAPTSSKIKVMAVHWVEETGIEAFTEQVVERGDVANYPDRVFPEKKKAAGGPRGAAAPAVPALGAANDTIDVDYMTEALVLDIDGYDLIPGRDRLRKPGALAMLSPEGELIVRQETEDLRECHRLILTNPPEPDPVTQPLPAGRGAAAGGQGNLDRLSPRPRPVRTQ